MPGVGDLADPVSYSAWWVVVAVALPLLVVAWYAGVTWWTRDRSVSHRPEWLRLWSARREHLRELDRIEAAVADGRMSPRQGHQAVSATVRSFVAAVGPVDARVLNLAQLRQAAPAQVVGIVETVYPPAFEPWDRAESVDRLGDAVVDARELVTGWRR